MIPGCHENRFPPLPWGGRVAAAPLLEGHQMQLYTVWLEAAARPMCIQLHCTREFLFYGLSVCPSARLRAKLFGGTKQYIDLQTAESWRSRTDQQMLFSLERELFFECTEWGAGAGGGLGLTDRFNPRRRFFAAPCGCGREQLAVGPQPTKTT